MNALLGSRTNRRGRTICARGWGRNDFGSSLPGFQHQGTFDQVDPRTPPDQCFTGLRTTTGRNDCARWLGSKTTLASSLPGIASIQDTFNQLDKVRPPISALLVAEKTTWSKRLGGWQGRNDLGQFSSWIASIRGNLAISWTKDAPISALLGCRTTTLVETIARVLGRRRLGQYLFLDCQHPRHFNQLDPGRPPIVLY